MALNTNIKQQPTTNIVDPLEAIIIEKDSLDPSQLLTKDVILIERITTQQHKHVHGRRDTFRKLETILRPRGLELQGFVRLEEKSPIHLCGDMGKPHET